MLLAESDADVADLAVNGGHLLSGRGFVSPPLPQFFLELHEALVPARRDLRPRPKGLRPFGRFGPPRLALRHEFREASRETFSFFVAHYFFFVKNGKKNHFSKEKKKKKKQQMSTSANRAGYMELDVKHKRIRYKCACGQGVFVPVKILREVFSSGMHGFTRCPNCRLKFLYKELRQVYMMLLMEQNVFLGDDAL